MGNPYDIADDDPEYLSLLKRYGVEPPQAPKPKGGFFGDVARGTGQAIGAFGTVAKDLGAERIGGAAESYGMGLARRHPSEVSTLADVIEKPGTTVRESLGEQVPQWGANIGAGVVGRTVGGTIGGAIGGPPGAFAGQWLGGLSAAYLSNLAQEQGGIRQEQAEQGIDKPWKALAAAAPAAALDFAVGPEGKIIKNIAKKGLVSGLKSTAEDVAKDGFAKSVGKGFLQEGPLTEGPQSAMERWGAEKPLNDADAWNDYAVSSIKGGIGGSAMTGVMHPFGKRPQGEKPLTEDRPTNLLTPDMPEGPAGTQGELFDKEAFLNPNAPETDPARIYDTMRGEGSFAGPVMDADTATAGHNAEYQAQIHELITDRNEIDAYIKSFEDAGHGATNGLFNNQEDLERIEHAKSLRAQIENQMEALATQFYGDEYVTEKPNAKAPRAEKSRTKEGATRAEARATRAEDAASVSKTVDAIRFIDPRKIAEYKKFEKEVVGRIAPEQRQAARDEFVRRISGESSTPQRSLDYNAPKPVHFEDVGFGTDGYGIGNVESQEDRLGSEWQHDLLRSRTTEQQAAYEKLAPGQSFDLPGVEPEPKPANRPSPAQRELKRVEGTLKRGPDLSAEEEQTLDEYDRLLPQIEAKRKLVNPLTRVEQQQLERYADAIAQIDEAAKYGEPEPEQAAQNQKIRDAYAKLVNKQNTDPSRDRNLNATERDVLARYAKVQAKIEAAKKGNAYTRMVMERGNRVDTVDIAAGQEPGYDPMAEVRRLNAEAYGSGQLDLFPTPKAPTYGDRVGNGDYDPWAGVDRTEEAMRAIADPKTAKREDVERAIRTAFAEGKLKDDMRADVAAHEKLKAGEGSLARAIRALSKPQRLHIETEVEKMAQQAATAQRTIDALDALLVGGHRMLNEKGVAVRKAAYESLAAAEQYFANIDRLNYALAAPVKQRAELLEMLRHRNISAEAVAIELTKSLQKYKLDTEGSGVALHVYGLQVQEDKLAEHHEQLLQRLAEQIEANGGNIAVSVADLHALGVDISRLKLRKDGLHKIEVTNGLVPQYRRIIWAGAKEGSRGVGPDHSVPMYIPIMETYETKEGDTQGKFNKYGQYAPDEEGTNLHDPTNPYKERIAMGPATTEANGGDEPGILHIVGVRDKPKETRQSAAKMAPDEGAVAAMEYLSDILRTPGAGEKLTAMVSMVMRKVLYKDIAAQLGVSTGAITNAVQALRLSAKELQQLAITAGFPAETVSFAEILGDASTEDGAGWRFDGQGFNVIDSVANNTGPDTLNDAQASYIRRALTEDFAPGATTEELKNILAQREQARRDIDASTRANRDAKESAEFEENLRKRSANDLDLPKSFTDYGNLLTARMQQLAERQAAHQYLYDAERARWKAHQAARKANTSLVTAEEQAALQREHSKALSQLGALVKEDARAIEDVGKDVLKYEASKAAARKLLDETIPQASLEKEQTRAKAADEYNAAIAKRNEEKATLGRANAEAAEMKTATAELAANRVVGELGLTGRALDEMVTEATVLWTANERDRRSLFPLDWNDLSVNSRARVVAAVSQYYSNLGKLIRGAPNYVKQTGALFDTLKEELEDIGNGHKNSANAARVAAKAAGNLSEAASGTDVLGGAVRAHERRRVGTGLGGLTNAQGVVDVAELGVSSKYDESAENRDAAAYNALYDILSSAQEDTLYALQHDRNGAEVLSDDFVGKVWRSFRKEDARTPDGALADRMFEKLRELKKGYEKGTSMADALGKAAPDLVAESDARIEQEVKEKRQERKQTEATAKAIEASKKKAEASEKVAYERAVKKHEADVKTWARRIRILEQQTVELAEKVRAMIARRTALSRKTGVPPAVKDMVQKGIENAEAKGKELYLTRVALEKNKPEPPKVPESVRLERLAALNANRKAAEAAAEAAAKAAEPAMLEERRKAYKARQQKAQPKEQTPPVKEAPILPTKETLRNVTFKYQFPRAEGDFAALLQGDTVYFGNPERGTPITKAEVVAVKGKMAQVEYTNSDGTKHRVWMPMSSLRVDMEGLGEYVTTPPATEFSQSAQNGTGQDAKTMGATLRKLFFSPARFDKLVTIIQSKNQLTPAQYADLLTGSSDPASVQAVHRNGHIYMFADNIAPGNELAVFLHELGVHIGLVNLLGKAKYDQLIAQIEQWAKGSGKIENTLAKLAIARAASVGEGQKKSEFVAYFVEEAILHGADPTAVAMMREGPLKSWLRTVVAAMKSALRRLGFRNTDKLTAQNIVDMAYGAAALELTDSTEKAPLSNGSRDFSTASAVMQRVTDLFPSSKLNSSAWTNVKDAWHKFTPMWLTNTQLVERFGEKLKSLKTYVHLQQMADSTRQQIQADTQKVMVKWNALNEKTEATPLAKLMLEATTLQAHPDKAFTDPANAHLKPENKKAHAALAAAWNALSQGAKDTYNEARKVLDARWKLRNEAYHDTVNNMYNPLIAKETDAKTKARLIRNRDKAHAKYDKLMSSFKGPYFPMMRIGDYVVVGMSPKYAALKAEQKGATGDKLDALQDQIDALTSDPRHYSVSSYESAGEAEHAEKTLRTAEGFSTERLKREEFYATLSPMTTTGFADLGSAIDESGFDTKTASKIKAMMTDLFISALPENSALSREAKRRNVHGVKAHEMQRTFAISGERDAFYISRLKHSTEMNDALVDMQKEAKAEDNKSSAGFKYEHLHEEMKARMALDMTFNDNPIQNALSTLSWAYHLGVSPAFVFFNSTQPWLVTGPVLAGRFGLKPATDALTKAAADSFKILKAARTDKTKPLGERLTQALDLSGLPQEERAMAENLMGRRILDIGIEHDLSTEAQGTNPAMAKVQRVMSWATQQVELTNRLTTSLAAYRLAIGKGMTHDEAVDYAYDTTSQTQFDYNAGNTARVMREGGPVPMAKLIFQFRRYQQSMLYLLGKNFDAAFRGNDKDKAHARATLGYLFASQGLVAGTLGMPMAGVALALAGLGGDDDDEEGSPEVRWRNMLTKMVGKDAAMVLTDGIPTMFGVNISKRIGMGDVASPFPMAKFNNTQGNSKNTVGQAMVNAAGAPANLAVGLLDAKQFFASGQWDKGVEKLAQFAGKWPADILRAHRFSTEGMTDRQGRVIVPADKFTGADIMLRAAGFAPARESEYFLANNAKLDVTTAIKERRTALIDRLALRAEQGESISSLVKESDVIEFNAKHNRQGALGRITASDIQKKRIADEKIPRQRDASGVRYTKTERDFQGLTAFAR